MEEEETNAVDLLLSRKFTVTNKAAIHPPKKAHRVEIDERDAIQILMDNYGYKWDR